MTHTFKLLATSALALSLAACATPAQEAKMAKKEAVKAEQMAEMAKNDAKMAEKKAMEAGKNDAMSNAERNVKEGLNVVEGAIVSAGNPKVGGAAMYRNMTIVENASKAPNLTTLVSAVQQAELVDTLSAKGPFTVFAPTNTAFQGVPSETLNSLMQDANREALQKVLTGHVVSGKVTAADLKGQIMASGGSYTITTVSGDTLTAFVSGEKVKIADERGYVATVTTANVMQSNGVVHVIDSVLIGE